MPEPRRKPDEIESLRSSIAELLRTIDGKWGRTWHKRNKDVYSKLQLECRAVLELLSPEEEERAGVPFVPQRVRMGKPE